MKTAPSRNSNSWRNSTLISLAVLSLLNLTTLGQKLPQFNCGVIGSGSAVISDNQYSTGEFEFKIKPSFVNGLVTVFGLSDDGIKPKTPFAQLVFDYQQYGEQQVALILAGIDNLPNFTLPLNLKEAIGLTENQSLADDYTYFKLRRTQTSLSVFVQTRTGTPLPNTVSYVNVFDSDTYSNQTDMAFNDTLKQFPSMFNVHIGTWIDKNSLFAVINDHNFTNDDNSTDESNDTDSGNNSNTDALHAFDPTSIYFSNFGAFKASDLNGNIINQTNFNEAALQLFTAYSLTNSPVWTNISATFSVFHKSQALYQPASSGGLLSLQVNTNLLSSDTNDWTIDHGSQPKTLQVSFLASNSNDIVFSIDFKNLQTEQVGLVKVNLETLSAYSDYKVEICGNYTLGDSQTIQNWPIQASIIDRQTGQLLSQKSTINFQAEDSCQIITLSISTLLSTPVKQDLSDYAALSLDFSANINVFNMIMTTACRVEEIQNANQQIINSNMSNWSTKVIYTNEYVVEEEVTDLDFKSKYQVAVALFTIFFILLLVASGFFIYKFIKNRKVLAAESKTVKTFESQVQQKRQQLEEFEKLIGKNEEAIKQERQKINQQNGQQPRRGIQRAEEDDDDEALQAIYDVDGAIRNFGGRANGAVTGNKITNSKKKQNDIDVVDHDGQDMLRVSGIDISYDESNNTEIDKQSSMSDTMQSRAFNSLAQTQQQMSLKVDDKQQSQKKQADSQKSNVNDAVQANSDQKQGIKAYNSPGPDAEEEEEEWEEY
eukprot:403338641